LVIVRCHGLSKVWYSGEGCDLYGLWLVLLQSAKDLLLGVDPLGHVPPCVWYGTTCLLIRNTSGRVFDLVEQRGTTNTSLIPHGVRGDIAMENLSNTIVPRIP
jgi:hypothetical protein